MAYTPKGGNQILKEEQETEEIKIHSEFLHGYMMNMMKSAITNHRPFSFPCSPHHRIDFLPAANGEGYIMYYTFVKTLSAKPPAKERIVKEKPQKIEIKKNIPIKTKQVEDIVF